MSSRTYFLFMLLFIIMFVFFAAVTMDLKLGGQRDAPLAWNGTTDILPSAEIAREFLHTKYAYAVVGTKGNGIYDTVLQTLDYIKKSYTLVESVASINTSGKYNAIILTQRRFSDSDVEIIKELLAKGIPVLFAEMPDTKSFMTSADLMPLLGIEKISEDKEKQKGIYFIDGFLLGGRVTFDQSITTAYKVGLNSFCKTFARANGQQKGLLDIPNEEQNVLLWRTYYQNTPIFVFNNTFLYSEMGVGSLVSALANFEDVFAYPIISSFSVSLTDFPLAGNFDENAKTVFDRDTQGALRDTIFPTLVQLSYQTKIKFSFFSDNEDISDYWNKEAQKYDFSIYKSNFDTLPGIVTGSSFRSNSNTDFTNRSLITALGLVNQTASLKEAFDPAPENHWRLLSQGFTAELYTLSDTFAWLPKYTYDNAIIAMNEYFSFDPSFYVSRNHLTIRCSNFSGRATLLVRLKDDRELISTDGAEVTEIEKGVYRVILTVPEVSLKIVRQV